MRKGLLVTLLTSIFVLGGSAIPSFASGIAANPEKEMYATKGMTGSSIARYRTDVGSALGNNKNRFYSIGNHNFSKFAFDSAFYNVDGGADIEFSEITWGNSWHEEAVEVYLVNPRVKTCTGAEKAYGKNDIISAVDRGGINLSETDIEELRKDKLYFAGVAFNKRVIQNGNVANYTDYETRRFKEISGDWTNSDEDTKRKFVTSNITTEGDVAITGFNLPENIVSAEGIVLVDVTGKINKMYYKDDTKFGDDGFDLASVKVYGKSEINEGSTDKNEKAAYIKVSDLRNAEIADRITRDIVLENGDVVGSYTLKLNDNKKKFRLTYELNDGYKLTDERYGLSFNSFEEAKERTVKLDKSITIEKLSDDDMIYISIGDHVAKK